MEDAGTKPCKQLMAMAIVSHPAMAMAIVSHPAMAMAMSSCYKMCNSLGMGASNVLS